MACTNLNGSLLLRLPPPPKTLAPNSVTNKGNLSFRRCSVRGFTSVRASAFSVPHSQSADDSRPEIDEYPEGIISGEWPENHSFLSYDDLRAYLETQIISDKMKPTTLLGEVMSTRIRAATADQTLEEIDHHFEFVSGLPVVDEEIRCVGVISKKDKAKASNGLKSKVGEVMSTPPITLSPDKTVFDAAALMLKNKIHRIPVLNAENRVIGMVTRTDIFRALETAAV